MQDIEKLYKEKLENHSSPVSDEVWQNIASALEKQKDKRRIYLMYLSAIALILAAILGYIIFNKYGKSASNSKKDKTEHNRNATAIKQNAKTNKTLLELDNSVDNYHKKEAQNLGLAQNTSIHRNDNSESAAKISDTKAKQNNKNNNGLLTTNSDLKKHKSLNNPNSYNTVKNNKKVVENTSGNHNSNVNITSFLERRFIANPIELKSRLNTVEKTLINSKLLTKRNQGILNDCFPTKKDFLYLEAYYSNDYNQKALYGDNYEFIKSREKTESNMYSYSMGMMLGYLFSNGFSVKTGLNYTAINEKFNVTFKKVINTQTIITIDTIINNDGSETVVRDTTVKEIFGERRIQENNTYTMFDIPLIIGLEYRKFNHKLGISAGVIFNITSRQKGIILNHIADTQDIEKIDSDNKIFRRNTGISIYTGIVYSYRFRSRYEFFIEPNIRYYLKSFTRDNYILRQNYAKYGISFGGRYIF